MTEEQPEAVHDWPDEEGGQPAQDGLRSDVGGSMQRPMEEDTPVTGGGSAAGERGPRGAGDEPGRGELGTHTSGDEGAEQGPR